MFRPHEQALCSLAPGTELLLERDEGAGQKTSNPWSSNYVNDPRTIMQG